MAINKVIYGNDTLIDITSTTATASDVASGKVFFTKDGTQTTGTASGGSVTVATATVTNSSNTATSLQFTVSGEPRYFVVRQKPSSYTSLSSSNYYYIIDIVYNGTSHFGNYSYKNSRVYADTSHYSHSYSNGKLTVSSSGSRSGSGGSFINTTYELIYIY